MISLAGLLFGPAVDVVYRAMTPRPANPHIIAAKTNLDVGIVRFALADLATVGLVVRRNFNGGEYAAVPDTPKFVLAALGGTKAAAAVVARAARAK